MEDIHINLFKRTKITTLIWKGSKPEPGWNFKDKLGQLIGNWYLLLIRKICINVHMQLSSQNISLLFICTNPISHAS